MSVNSLAIALALILLAGTGWSQPVDGDVPHLGSHASSNKAAFRGVIENRCIVCHERPLVEEAVRTEELGAMQRHMLEQGIPLSEREKRVLGTFWGEPLREKDEMDAAGPSVTEADYHRFRQILQTRCTGCHSLERVEEAMTRQRSYEAVIQEMLRRGAVLSEWEIAVLRKFWGRDAGSPQ